MQMSVLSAEQLSVDRKAPPVQRELREAARKCVLSNLRFIFNLPYSIDRMPSRLVRPRVYIDKKIGGRISADRCFVIIISKL